MAPTCYRAGMKQKRVRLSMRFLYKCAVAFEREDEYSKGMPPYAYIDLFLDYTNKKIKAAAKPTKKV